MVAGSSNSSYRWELVSDTGLNVMTSVQNFHSSQVVHSLKYLNAEILSRHGSGMTWNSVPADDFKEEVLENAAL